MCSINNELNKNYNILIIRISKKMLCYSNMWMGVFADVGVTLLAILNSMRILK